MDAGNEKNNEPLFADDDQGQIVDQNVVRKVKFREDNTPINVCLLLYFMVGGACATAIYIGEERRSNSKCCKSLLDTCIAMYLVVLSFLCLSSMSSYFITKKVVEIAYPAQQNQ